MSRIGWLEQAVGFDRLAVWHRWTGFAAVTLLSAHAVLITCPGCGKRFSDRVPACLFCARETPKDAPVSAASAPARGSGV